MSVFLITFDLDRIGNNYTSIRKKLVAMDALQAHGTLWFARHEGTAEELRGYLQDCLQQNDRLFVGMVTGNWSGINMNHAGRWLREQVSPAPG
jgi:hypothetical protein